MTAPRHPDLATPAEAAAIVGVNTKTLQRWAAKGWVAYPRTLGGHRRYRVADLLALREGPWRRPCTADDMHELPDGTWECRNCRVRHQV